MIAAEVTATWLTKKRRMSYTSRDMTYSGGYPRETQRLGPILRSKQQLRIPKRRTGMALRHSREHTTLSHHPSSSSS